MLFSAPEFLFFFFPIALTILLALPRSTQLQNVFLLFASCLFYAWGEGLYLFLLLASVLFNYLMGHLLADVPEKMHKPLFIFGIASNLLILAAYKYTPFLAENLNVLLGSLQLPQRFVIAPLHLPIGISFFTFHGIIYLVNVQVRGSKPERDIIKLGLYFCFFPQLLAGPIIRYEDVKGELGHRVITAEGLAQGARRFIVGLSKKVLLAQSLGFVSDLLFQFRPDALTFTTAWLGAVCFCLQIYFDFSGYSDMAIGMARMCGFHFKENFNYPYIASSISELWKRWHISLTSLARDYLYTPLALHAARAHPRRRGIAVQWFPVLFTFTVIGLWHGAAWKFLLFGFINGLAILAENLFAKSLQQVPVILRHAYTLIFWAMVCVIFRDDDISSAAHYIAVMSGLAIHANVFIYPLDAELYLCLFVGCIAATPLLKTIFNDAELRYGLGSTRIPLFSVMRDLGLALLLFLSAASIAAGTIDNFIYFRF